MLSSGLGIHGQCNQEPIHSSLRRMHLDHDLKKNDTIRQNDTIRSKRYDLNDTIRND